MAQATYYFDSHDSDATWDANANNIAVSGHVMW